jgi:hypothetical protein
MPTYVQIGSTVTVGSGGAANIQFTAIPTTFTDLVVVYSLRSVTSGAVDNVNFEFNNSSANFIGKAITGNGASISSSNYASNRFYGLANANTSTSNTFGNGEIYITNYLSSANKSFAVNGVQEDNSTTAFARMTAGLWSNSAAITSIKIVADSAANWMQHSTASLYGISNA